MFGKDAKAVADRERLLVRLCNRVIRELQQMQDPSMLLAGEDSGLTNVWDEICVQRQTEESFAWTAYEVTMRTLIDGVLDDYSHRHLCELWLVTEKGEDWRFDHPENQRPAPCKSDVVDFLFEALLSKAEKHSNARIRAYVDRCTRTD